MTTGLESLLPQIKAAQVDINIHVSAQLNVSPFIARQKVNRLLLTEASTGLGGDEPHLVVSQEHLCWRVPIHLALPSRGKLGQVGEIDVDVQTGQVLVDEDQLQEIVDHAERLLVSSPLSPES